MTPTAVSAEILPPGLAPVPVVLVFACLILSLVLPNGTGRREILVVIAAEACVFVIWVVSGAPTCAAACTPMDNALTVAALGVGPILILLLVLVAAWRLSARTYRAEESDPAQGAVPSAQEEAPGSEAEVPPPAAPS